jgi:hypothetical protein
MAIKMNLKCYRKSNDLTLIGISKLSFLKIRFLKFS